MSVTAEGRVRWHGIEAAGMEGMTSPDPSQREPTTAQDTEARNGLECVAGAGRIKAAGRAEQRAQCALIQPDQECCGGAHCSVTRFHNAARLARNTPLAAPRTAARPLTTKSIGGSSRWRNRKDSRTTRRMRLRCTELPAALVETARPRRGSTSFGRAITVKNPSPKRRPRA